MRRIVIGNNLSVLRSLADGSVPLIYADPPFNTGKTQARIARRTVHAAGAERLAADQRDRLLAAAPRARAPAAAGRPRRDS